MSMPQSHDMNLRAIKQFFNIDTLSMTISTKFQVLNPDHLGDRASRSAQPYYRLGKSQNVQFLLETQEDLRNIGIGIQLETLTYPSPFVILRDKVVGQIFVYFHFCPMQAKIQKIVPTLYFHVGKCSVSFVLSTYPAPSAQYS